MLAVGHDSHYLIRQCALEQFEHRADVPGTCVFDRCPGGGFEFFDADSDLVQLRTADNGFDTPGLDVQMADGPVTDVSAPAWQAVGVVGKGFQMLAPAFAPEAAGDGAPVNGHGLDVFAFFAQLVHLPPCCGAAFGYRYISPPFSPQCHSAPPYPSARVTSRRTSCNSSSSGNAVRLTSPSLRRM